MIKIELDSLKRSKIEEKHYKEMCGAKYAIKSKLSKLANNRDFVYAKPCSYFLLKNVKEVLVGQREDLSKIIKVWESYISSFSTREEKKYKNFLLEKIFRYDYFARPRKKMYCAHSLAEDLNLKTCSYCNRNYIFTWVKGDSRARCQFDHFLPKSEYPFFALSLYNLIPSCALCNCYEKRNTIFSLESHHHPYFDSGDEVFRFKIVSSQSEGTLSPLFWYGEDAINNFKIKIVPQVGLSTTDSEFLRLMNNQEILQLESYYNEHKDYALEIIRKAHFYPKIYNETLQAIMKDFNFYTIRLKEFYVGNYLISSEFQKRTLSKLTKDIAEQFCLI